jgi:RNA polymerase-binding transcription factor DksA
MQTYVEKEHQHDKDQNDVNDMHNQKKFFENIDSIEENDDQKDEQFVYNLKIDSFDICKKCDIRREIF